MSSFTLTYRISKYSVPKWSEEVTIVANDRDEAKQKAIEIANSTRWAMDLTAKPDLRSLKLLTK